MTDTDLLRERVALNLVRRRRLDVTALRSSLL